MKRLGDHDPYLIPLSALLAGWGILTMWRLDPHFGLRQTLWFVLGMALLGLAIRYPNVLAIIRRYKYLLLSGGLLLTALTLIFGANPIGDGPNLWLGCCNLYFQPSEPLKLLLVIYLSSYFADRQPYRLSGVVLLAPTILLTGLAILLLVEQRDLGTASIIISIYTIILYMATGNRKMAAGIVLAFVGAMTLGYAQIDIIRNRVQSWLYPWADPAGQSYQIVQSLLAVANGGLIGRGAGIGNPLLVPVSISDFVFSAIAEETGLVGVFGLLGGYWLILARGMIISLNASDRFRRLLAIGIVTHFGIQSLLIIGGNLRLIPLTGITLPFLSYGGSSLLTSFAAIALLLIISSTDEMEPAPLSNPERYSQLGLSLGIGLAIIGLSSMWWTIIRGQTLLDRTDNARRAIADRFVRRGSLVDRNNLPINITIGESGDFSRIYLYPDLAPTVGYTHPIFGQSGLEFTLDPYLRGLQGNPALRIWWEHLLYGTPPPGLDVRLSIDLALQSEADRLLGATPGAIILMNAASGELLATASHPTYDPNRLDEIGATLAQNPNSPLLDRTSLGAYPIGQTLLPFIEDGIAGRSPTERDLLNFLDQSGSIVVEEDYPIGAELRISPIQMAAIAASLSNRGLVPDPRIVLSINRSTQGWTAQSNDTQSRRIYSPEVAIQIADSLLIPGKPIWGHTVQVHTESSVITWLLAGSHPEWGGVPIVLVAALEGNHPARIRSIREGLLSGLVE
jgi:cell division protein FtsW (lipid II flippase)